MGDMIPRLAAKNVEEVDEAAPRIFGRDLEAIVLAQTVRDHLVAGHAHADHEIVADGLAHRLQDFDAESHAVLETAAVFVGALVDRG